MKFFRIPKVTTIKKLNAQTSRENPTFMSATSQHILSITFPLLFPNLCKSQM